MSARSRSSRARSGTSTRRSAWPRSCRSRRSGPRATGACSRALRIRPARSRRSSSRSFSRAICGVSPGRAAGSAHERALVAAIRCPLRGRARALELRTDPEAYMAHLIES
jgi:hypothetical protein